MNTKELMGYLAIILSGILLALELYGLTFIQYIDMNLNDSFYTNAFDYIYKTPISLAFLITIGISILGLSLIIKAKRTN